MVAEEEIKESLKKHTILEHFKAKLPPILMEPPTQINEEEAELGLNEGSEHYVHGNWKCSVCSRTFDQIYQRRIHERYYHTGM